MIIDGKKVVKTLLDNDLSILRRFSYEKKTLPEFVLLIPEEEEAKKSKKKKDIYTTRYLIDEIKAAGRDREIDSYWQDLLADKKAGQRYFNVSAEELAQLWWIFNFRNGKVTYLEKKVKIEYTPTPQIRNPNLRPDPVEQNWFDEFLNNNQLNAETVLNQMEPEEKVIHKKGNKKNDRGNPKSTITILEERLQRFFRKEVEDIQYMDEFQTFEKKESTEPETVGITHEVSFDVDYDIYELFNDLKMSRDLPFAYIGNYYKILKEFTPTIKWITLDNTRRDNTGDDEILYLRVLNVKTEPNRGDVQDRDSQKKETPSDYMLYSTIKIRFESFYDTEKRLKLEQEERDQKDERDKIYRDREEKRRKKQMKEEKKSADVNRIKRKKSKMTVEEEEQYKEEENKRREEKEIAEEEERKENEIANEKIRRLREQIQEKVDEEMRKKYENVDIEKSRVYMIIQSVINPDLNVEQLTQRIFKAFSDRTRENIQTREVSIKSEFNVPEFELERPIFLDMAMNEVFFKKLVYVDEHDKIGKQKGGLKFSFSMSLQGGSKLVSCELVEKVVAKKDKVIALHKKLVANSKYIKIRVSGIENEEMVRKFRNIFTRMLTRYEDQRDTVVNEYKKYAPEFLIEPYLEEQKQIIETKTRHSLREGNMLKDIAWRTYISGYARQCPKKAVPIIVAQQDPNTDEEPFAVQKLRETYPDQNVILFPKDKDEDVDGVQFWYTCNPDSKKYKYIGLRKSKLKNADEYPLIPCCYIRDHSQQAASLYHKYYNGKKAGKPLKLKDFRGYIPPVTKDGGHIMGSRKMLFEANRLAVLETDIDTFLRTADGIGSDMVYYRRGASDTVNSALESINRAINPSDVYDTNGGTLKEIRKKLINYLRENKSNISQEAYLYTPETIKNYLEDDNKYLDPKLFYRLLEDFFNCYIYIFHQSPSKFPNGILACPYYIREYLQREKIMGDKNRNVVILYEHYGAETNHVPHPHPHCELVVQQYKDEKDEKGIKKDPKKVTSRAVFTANMELVKNLEKAFLEMYVTQIDRTTVFPVILPFKSRVVAQGIDYYGKTRYLQFAEFEKICLLTNPLPPYNYSEDYTYAPISRLAAKRFLQYEGIEKSLTVRVGENIVGIKAQKGNIVFYIPIHPVESLESNENDLPVMAPTNIYPGSQIELYNEYNRRARYMVEYILYLFSLFYLEDKAKRNEPIVDGKYLLKFMRTKVEIDETYSYKKKILRAFSMQAGLLRDRKLVVPNIMVSKKLLYMLQLNLRRRYTETLHYSSHKYMQSYFADITDFEQKKDQIILYGRDSLDHWISKKNLNYALSDSILPANASLYAELQKYPLDNIYMLMFTAAYCKSCKFIQSRIYTASKKGNKRKVQILADERVAKNVNVLYVDIDENPGLKALYGVSVVPTFIFLHVKNEVITKLETIVGNELQQQTVKTVYNTMKDLVDKKLDGSLW